MRDYIEFWKQFRERFETTGAVAPSSRFLARAMTRPFASRTRPARILEVGPGTGAVTRQIVRLMRPDDQLDLVELNPKFVEILRNRFEHDEDYRRVSAQCRLHNTPLQEFQSDGKYDYVVSGLPLNNFPAGLVAEIFDAIFALMAPGGTLSYFEYMYVRPMRRAVSGGSERTRLTELEKIISTHLTRHGFARDWVFVNLPPAWVQHLRGGEVLADATKA